MELVYIYFKEYKGLKFRELNFNKFLEFSLDQNDNSLKLKSDHGNNSLGSNFFGKNISNVTAILGKNGSGKSTILDFICRNLTSINSDFIKIFKGGDSIFYIFSSIINLDVNSITNCELIPVYEAELITTTIIPHDFNFVYYSSYFDGNNMQPISKDEHIKNKNPKLFDISTSYLVKQHERFSERSVDQYTRNEFNRLLHLVSSGYRLENTKIKYPDFLFIQPDLDLLEQMIREAKPFEDAKLKDIVNKLYDRVKDNKKDTVDSLYLTFIIALLIKIDDEFDYTPTPLDKWDIVENEIDNGLSNLLNALISEEFLNKFSFFDKIKENASEFIQILQDINDKLAFETSSPHFPFKEVNRLILFLSHYRFDRFYPFEFIWSFSQERIPAQFSSGERIMLSLYSRLFDMKIREISDKYLIVLLDEPDIGLHPQWQKMFLNEILKFLSSHFSDATIQLIITSHSPFIASDLPNDNVIYLGAPDGYNPKTFAGNIHDLLADSFFMEDGFVGEFAKGKIKEIIGLLKNNENPKGYNQEYVKALINEIAEPTVRRKLLEEYSKKYGDFDDLIKIIENEKLRIEKLKADHSKRSEND